MSISDHAKARISRLETNALEQEVVMMRTRKEQQSFLSEKQEGTCHSLKKAEELKGDLEELKRGLSELTIRFRELAKKEYVEQVERKINAWKLESFITRKEFEKLLKNSF